VWVLADEVEGVEPGGGRRWAAEEGGRWEVGSPGGVGGREEEKHGQRGGSGGNERAAEVERLRRRGCGDDGEGGGGGEHGATAVRRRGPASGGGGHRVGVGSRKVNYELPGWLAGWLLCRGWLAGRQTRGMDTLLSSVLS
jgi:hypothetical protein